MLFNKDNFTNLLLDHGAEEFIGESCCEKTITDAAFAMLKAAQNARHAMAKYKEYIAGDPTSRNAMSLANENAEDLLKEVNRHVQLVLDIATELSEVVSFIPAEPISADAGIAFVYEMRKKLGKAADLNHR